MAKIQRYSMKCTWTISANYRAMRFQMLDLHNQFHLRYLRDHTVNKVHKRDNLIKMIKKMIRTINHQDLMPNLFPKVIKLWLTFQHVNLESSQSIWLANMVNNSSMKVSKLLEKTAVCSTKNKERNNWSKCLVTYSLPMLIPWMVSLTSAQPTWLCKTCNAESIFYRRCTHIFFLIEITR